MLTVWKTLGHTDGSYRAFLAMRQVLRGLDADIAHSNRSEAKMAAPYFDRVLDAGKLLCGAEVTEEEMRRKACEEVAVIAGERERDRIEST